YELASDTVFRLQNAPMIALIHYDHTNLLPSQLAEMLRFHPIILTGRYLKHNRYVDSAAQSSCGHIPRNNIPEIGKSTVLRTDFSDDRVWQVVCAAIEEPVGDFRAYVTFVSDRAFERITVEKVVARVKKDVGFLFIVDDMTISHKEHPILVVDLRNEPGRTFRVIPSEMWSVENNLSIANLSFWEFANSADDDGVFRGFGDYSGKQKD
ncbi:MAG TPA: hypothetical protein VHZ51_07820, partial [Ktedonobacteraceae bacterium]|nr:hypothetical protein [Ktedonobacteraceae bacterium]